MIKLYALSTCPWCKKVKQLFDEHKVKYECIDVDLLTTKEEQTRALEEVEQLTGKRSFPVTVAGDTVIKGYQVDELLKVIQDEA